MTCYWKKDQPVAVLEPGYSQWVYLTVELTLVNRLWFKGRASEVVAQKVVESAGVKLSCQ